MQVEPFKTLTANIVVQDSLLSSNKVNTFMKTLQPKACSDFKLNNNMET